MLTDTTRKMASIQEIEALSPVLNSDFLEVATMKGLGWKVVVKRGEFRAGDLVVYFEIDSAINVHDLPKPLEFLKDKGTKKLFTGKTPETSAFSGEYVRIKTVRLRGQISQGLIVPITDIQKMFPWYRFPNIPDIGDSVGADLTKELNVEVWDRLVEWYEERSQLGRRAGMHAAGSFPSDVPKTDEPRIQTEFFRLTKDPENVNALWEVTEKNDGSSATLFYRPETWPENPMRLASRRFLLKDDGFSDDWFKPFKADNLKNIQRTLEHIWRAGILIPNMSGLFPYNHELAIQGRQCGRSVLGLFPRSHELAIQGEIVGPRFNDNRDKHAESHFRVFRIFDITDQKFVSPTVRYAICETLGLEHVKVIDPACQVFKKFKSVDEILAYADGRTDNGNPREGLVFKRIDNGFVSFKAVSNAYLLGQKD